MIGDYAIELNERPAAQGAYARAIFGCLTRNGGKPSRSPFSLALRRAVLVTTALYSLQRTGGRYAPDASALARYSLSTNGFDHSEFQENWHDLPVPEPHQLIAEVAA